MAGLTGSGAFAWGGDYGDWVAALAVGTDGAIYTAGDLNRAEDFDPGDGVTLVEPAGPGNAAYICKLSPLSGSEGEGEGEGEGEPAPGDIAAALSANFSSSDSDNNGLLSLAEAQAAQPAISQGLFDVWDSNDDGGLSAAELNAVNRPPGSVGCTPGPLNWPRGCSWTGDLIALLLALLVLASRTGLITRRG